MDILNKVMEMQSQGMSEGQISKQLQSQGVNPKDISDALNQAKVKNAVSSNQEQGQMQDTNMQQSIMQKSEDSSEYSNYSPEYQQMQDTNMQQNQQMQSPQPQQEQEYQEYYPQANQAYPQQDYYNQYSQQDSYMDVDTITEIAEQVVAEKFSDFEKKTGDLVGFKNQVLDDINNLSERLRRIENSIDKLQQAVIQKIGDFGQSTEIIKKDLSALHDTTSKLMNPLIDNYKELKKIASKK